MRKVILHYHLFKNAGTSLDAAFKENFSEENGEWVTKEFPNQPAANREQVRRWILDNPNAKCFSSHTASLPVPDYEDIKVFPVIFIRHPLDRIASAYSFEQKQGGNGFGATLARNATLAGYIETRLTLTHDRQCRNFHTHRLAAMYLNNNDSELSRAKHALQALPFVGLVEKYSNCIEELQLTLRNEGFEGIKLVALQKNVSRKSKKSLEDKLLDIKKIIGDSLYRKLIDLNRDDLELWENLISQK